MLNIRWTKTDLSRGSKTIKGFWTRKRFALYRNKPGALPMMWTLYDGTTKTQWFLFAETEKAAKEKANERIESILTGVEE